MHRQPQQSSAASPPETESDTAPWRSFLHRFEDIAARYPDHAAIITDGADVMRYAQLRAQARAFGLGLRLTLDERTEQNSKAQSITPVAPRIALHIPKSASYLVALLGCWYAGAAFIPLDPALPQERRDFILRDLEPDLCVFAGDELGLDAPCPTASFEAVIGAHLPDSDLFFDQVTHSGKSYDGLLAYIIYTSGSTGTPKGVMVDHDGLVNVLSQQIAAFDMQAGDRSLFLLSIGFDASVSDIGCALLAGAALCIETLGRLEMSAALPALMTARGITHVDIAPSVLRLLSPDDAPKTLRSIIIGGEVCPPETVRRWAGRVRLTNVYGPTEATICTSMVRCTPDAWDRPLIGDAMDNVVYRVVDEAMKDVAPDDQGDASGELLIGGVQLARGYWRRDALNAAKFIVLDGQRFYRTGDRVTRHADSAISFVGRIDRQVKIRGQLVEPEEIETTLARHPAIARAAVLVRHDHVGKASLVAFYSLVTGHPHDDQETAQTLRDWLAARLPEWMIPATMIALAHFPLTASGKIDGAALSRMPIANASSQQSTPPQTPTQHRLYALWHDVLKHDDFGIDDAFFAVGGDSIDVISLCIAADKNGLSLSPAAMANHPTIRAMADFLDTPSGTDAAEAQAGGMSAADLRRFAALPEDIRDLIETLKNCQAHPAPKPAQAAQTLFFTGATGFLGARLLHDLLNATDWRFCCLVRANDPQDGLRRIHNAMAGHGLTMENAQMARLEMVIGDLSAPRFGLDEEAWQRLGADTDMIVHCAAVVNMVRSFEALKSANLDPCFDILRLAMEGGRARPVHYMSTLSVFVSTDQNSGTVFEHDMLEHTQTVYGGYAQTKWAAEIALHGVPFDVCPVTSYRLGLITGDCVNGYSPQRDFLGLFVKGLAEIGAIPDAEPSPNEMMIDVTPVDYACAVLGRLIGAEAQDSAVYHIANTRGFSLRDIMRGMARAGHEVGVVPAAKWGEMVREKTASSLAAQAAQLALCRFLGADQFNRLRSMDLFQATGITFDMARVCSVLSSDGGEMLVCPAADEELLDLYLKRMFVCCSHGQPADKDSDNIQTTIQTNAPKTIMTSHSD